MKKLAQQILSILLLSCLALSMSSNALADRLKDLTSISGVEITHL